VERRTSPHLRPGYVSSLVRSQPHHPLTDRLYSPVPAALPRFTAAQAAICTAYEGVGATPWLADDHIGCAGNVARHSPSAMWPSDRR
jgi:hypothetical protein